MQFELDKGIYAHTVRQVHESAVLSLPHRLRQKMRQ